MMKNSLYQNVKIAFRKNYSFSIISFVVMSVLFDAAYFVFGLISVWLAKFPFFVYPAFLLFAYFYFALIFGFHFLIYNLYADNKAFLGQLFFFFRDIRMIYVTLFYLIFDLIFLVLAFIPYYFFADKMLDKEIYGLILAQDVSAILKLGHGFSKSFYASVAFWLFLCLFFSFSFVALPICMAQNKKISFFKVIGKSLHFVYGKNRFSTLILLCVKCVFIPFAVCVCTFALSFLLSHFKMMNVSQFFSFFGMISLCFVYLYSLFAVSAFLNDDQFSKPAILLLPPPPDYSESGYSASAPFELASSSAPKGLVQIDGVPTRFVQIDGALTGFAQIDGVPTRFALGARLDKMLDARLDKMLDARTSFHG